jgi:maltooligosyltrehalose trehalohydrolase
VPDPQDQATFERSRLAPEHGDPALRECYERLIALRRRLPRALEVEFSEEERWLEVRRGAYELRVDFAAGTAELAPV